MEAGGAENLANMIRFLARRDFRLPVEAAPPRELPQAALWDPVSGQMFDRFEDYAEAYLARRGGTRSRP